MFAIQNRRRQLWVQSIVNGGSWKGKGKERGKIAVRGNHKNSPYSVVINGSLEIKRRRGDQKPKILKKFHS